MTTSVDQLFAEITATRNSEPSSPSVCDLAPLSLDDLEPLPHFDAPLRPLVMPLFAGVVSVRPPANAGVKRRQSADAIDLTRDAPKKRKTSDILRELKSKMLHDCIEMDKLAEGLAIFNAHWNRRIATMLKEKNELARLVAEFETAIEDGDSPTPQPALSPPQHARSESTPF